MMTTKVQKPCKVTFFFFFWHETERGCDSDKIDRQIDSQLARYDYMAVTDINNNIDIIIRENKKMGEDNKKEKRWEFSTTPQGRE